MNKLKYVLPVCGVLCVASSAWGGNAEADQALRLVLELTDGSRVVGIPAISSIPVQTSYAKMNIPLQEILNVRIEADHERVSVEFKNGDKLTGVLNLGPIQLETVSGKASVRVEHIRALRVVRGGAVSLPMPLSDRLVLYYSFDRDEGDRVTDLSGSGHDGTVRGAKWARDGRIGGAYEFDGRSTYIEVPHSPSLNIKTQITVCAWIQIGQIPGYGWWPAIVEKRSAASHLGGYGLLQYSEQSRMEFEFPALHPDRTAITKTSLPLNTWVHVAGTYDGKETRIYVNGSLDVTVRSDISKEIAESTSNVFIGRRSYEPVFFKGSIDEVMIFDRALSAEEIKQIYSSAGEGPVLHYAFDKDEGEKVTDLSGKGNHGTVVGARYTPQGKKGGAYCLSGTNEHITIPNSDSLEIRDKLTLAVWVNLATLGPGGYGNEHGYIINKGDDLWWNPAFCLGYNKGGEPLFHVGNATDPQRGGGKSAFGTTKLEPGKWYHLAGVYDGATVKLYVNGNLEKTEEYSGRLRSDRAPVHLGGGKLFGVDWGNHFTVHGVVDEVIIYNRALSAEEIERIRDSRLDAAAPLAGT